MKSTICKSICILVTLLSGVCSLSAKGSVTIGMQLDSLKQHYGVSFVYDSSAIGTLLENQVPSDFRISGKLEEDLKSLLRNVPVVFQLRDRYVILKKESDSGSPKEKSSGSKSLSGFVKDSNGEALAGVTVYEPSSQIGISTNSYGFYSLTLDQGVHDIVFSCFGFTPDTLSVTLTSDCRYDPILGIRTETLDEAKVLAYDKKDDLRLYGTGQAHLNQEILRKIPALGGEKDLIRALQLLPGVQSTSEGTTSFSVRGGGIDQNQVLLDEAPVINAGHFLGYFSVFNNDAIRDVNLYKGDMDAKYGGYLSSALDIHMKEGRNDRFGGMVDIGLISSKLMLEGPIGDKLTFMLSGRRTYMDLFFPLFKELKGTTFYFYDLNGKINWQINQNNKLYLSAFTGKDSMGGAATVGQDQGAGYHNSTVTLRWNHIFSPRFFSNLTAVHSNYNCNYDSNQGENLYYTWVSGLKSYGLKMDNTWYLNPSNTVEFGVHAQYLTLSPGEMKPLNETTKLDYTYPLTHSVQLDAYVQNTQQVGSFLSLRYGLRFSNFLTLGKTTQHYYKEDHTPDYTKEYGAGEVISYFNGLEPRFSASFLLSESLSVKASYNRNVQYLQQAAYSVSGSPFEVWYSVSPNVKPQISNQFALGLFKNFLNDRIETSVELFYKRNKNTIDFKDHPEVLGNEYLEGELRFGKSYAYGAEFMFKYDISKFNGWVAYTYTRGKHEIPEINGGRPYDSPRIHNHYLSLVANYDINRRMTLSANWVFYTGGPTTYPRAAYSIAGTTVALYSDRNSDRLPNHHRLDLSLILNGKNHGKRRVYGDWNFSIYNAYGNKNAWAVFYEKDDQTKQMKSKMLYLFSIIPSVSYSLHF